MFLFSHGKNNILMPRTCTVRTPVYICSSGTEKNVIFNREIVYCVCRRIKNAVLWLDLHRSTSSSISGAQHSHALLLRNAASLNHPAVNQIPHYYYCTTTVRSLVVRWRQGGRWRGGRALLIVPVERDERDEKSTTIISVNYLDYARWCWCFNASHRI